MMNDLRHSEAARSKRNPSPIITHPRSAHSNHQSTIIIDKYRKRIQMAFTVIPSRCPRNHPCPSVQVCPVGAITQEGFAAPVIDPGKCIDCGKCQRFCPMGAFRM